MQEKIAKLKELKLLFVEDETDLIQIIMETLDKLQCNYLVASNGQQALDILKDNQDVDLIVTDINMPVMNGLEMIENIRNNPDLKDKEIIIMSAHTETNFIQSAKELGVDNYLLKPFDFIKFIDLIVSMDLK